MLVSVPRPVLPRLKPEQLLSFLNPLNLLSFPQIFPRFSFFAGTFLSLTSSFSIAKMHAKLTGQDVAKHNNKDSCWVIVHGKAYDVTEFLPEHPGGSKIILKYAGKDATEEFDPIHPPDTLDKVSSSQPPRSS
jgi:cytochrome b involved in lipid metabolism